MDWIRHVVLDLVVTVVVIIAALTLQPWALWIVWIYTGFLLLLKIAALFAPAPKKAPPVPDMVYHVLYGISTLALLYAGQYVAAGGWAAIWILSAIQASRIGSKG